MITYDECFPCFLRQATDSCKLCNMNQKETSAVLEDVNAHAKSFSRSQSPIEMAVEIHKLVHIATGNGDPYAAIKHASNRACRDAMETLSTYITDTNNPFETAVKLAIAGNLIDFGAYKPVTLSEGHILQTVQETMEQPLSGNTVSELALLIEKAQNILFIGDNAGECFLDTFLLDHMPCERVTYAVRGRPILNDATLADAQEAGVHKRCRVIDTGDGTPGVIIERSSPDFQNTYHNADLVIAKGQGNYESLSDTPGTKRVFLTKVKCPVIARDIGYPLGSNVILITNA